MTDEYIDEFALVKLLRAECKALGGQAAFGREHFINTALISYVLAGKSSPNERIVRALGYEREIRYRKVR